MVENSTRVVALVVYNGRIEFRQRIEYRQTTNCKVPQIGNKSRVETTLRLSIQQYTALYCSVLYIKCSISSTWRALSQAPWSTYFYILTRPDLHGVSFLFCLFVVVHASCSELFHRPIQSSCQSTEHSAMLCLYCQCTLVLCPCWSYSKLTSNVSPGKTPPFPMLCPSGANLLEE